MELLQNNDLQIDAAREDIMSAAFNRFRIYGYHKTTMAEIANDAGMSAANLYRYYENKQSLAKSCIKLHINERLERIHIAIRQPGLTASEKIRALTLAMLEHCHALYSEEHHLNMLIQLITKDSPDVLYEKIQHMEYAISCVLSEGVENNEFRDIDIPVTARAIYSAISSFDSPPAMSYLTLEEFRKRASEVVDLFISGIRVP